MNKETRLAHRFLIKDKNNNIVKQGLITFQQAILELDTYDLLIFGKIEEYLQELPIIK